MSDKLTDDVIGWMRGRGISVDTLQLMGIAGGSERFGEGPQRAVFFPYFENGTAVNYKARALAQKAFTQKKGGKQIFYNFDRVNAGPKDTVYIVEGEMDVLALIEAGIPANAVLSVPGGAPPTEAQDDPRQSRRYAYIEDALRNGLQDTHRFVLATDADDKGRFLRNDLAAVLGIAKCWFLDWPEGCKDANEMLLSDGADSLREFVRAAPKPWPVDGLYRLSEIPDPPKLELWKPGILEWGEKVQFAPTMVSVGTGYPGHGKTALAQFFCASIAREYGIKIAIMSAETRVKPYVRRQFRSFFTGRREIDMDQDMRDRADMWIDEHFLFLAHPDAQPTHSWLMNTAEVAVVRHGVRMLLTDPFNKLESDYDRRQMSETEWVGRCLDDHIHMARAFNIHSMILAHPSKPDATHKGAPNPYMISGSAHWYNRPDQIWGVHRPKMVSDGGLPATEAIFHHFKARVEELGHPCKLAIKLQAEKGRYVCDEFPGL